MSRSQAAPPTDTQKLEALGYLAGGVAHDFNNLLTVIIGGLDMILKDPTDIERVRRLAEAALAAGQRGEFLARQLLAFSRRQQQPLGEVHIAALVEQIEPLLRSFLGEAIDLSVVCESNLRPCWLDAGQFESALINLVVNAKDAMAEQGQIRLSVRGRALAEAELPNLARGSYVFIAVSDTGEGMTAEVLAKAISPFFTTKESGKGTGLGLAQVNGFAHQAGGHLQLTNNEGPGLTVTLVLPTIEPTIISGASTPPAFRA